MHNPCAVIPVYNHETAVPAVVDALLAAGLPCVLVDDASSPACAAVLVHLAQGENIHLIRLAVNQGKGGAVMAGLRAYAGSDLPKVNPLIKTVTCPFTGEVLAAQDERDRMPPDFALVAGAALRLLADLLSRQ